MLSEPMLISCDGGHAASGCLGPLFLLVNFPLAIRFEEVLLFEAFCPFRGQSLFGTRTCYFGNGERCRVASEP